MFRISISAVLCAIFTGCVADSDDPKYGGMTDSALVESYSARSEAAGAKFEFRDGVVAKADVPAVRAEIMHFESLDTLIIRSSHVPPHIFYEIPSLRRIEVYAPIRKLPKSATHFKGEFYIESNNLCMISPQQEAWLDDRMPGNGYNLCYDS